MKLFEAIFDNKHHKGVYGIAFVERPATEEDFIYLSKQDKIQFKTIDEEKRIVVGIVLQPNKRILRLNKETNESFKMFFKEETIKDLCYNFTIQGYNNNSNIEHSGEALENISFVENWIVEDQKMDKSNIYKLNTIKGSWVAAVKINNDDVWNDYVKTGKVKGFSVEGMLKLKEVKLNKLNMESEIKTGFAKLTDGLMVALSLKKKEAEDVKLGSAKIKDSDIMLQFEGDELAVGTSVWIDDENGQRVALDAGELPLEDGGILVIGENSIVAEIKTPEAPKEEVEQKEQLPNQSTIDAIKSVLIKYTEDFNAKLEEVNVKFTKMETENTELKKEVVKLSEQPASKPINSAVQQKDYSNMSNKEKMLFNREN